MGQAEVIEVIEKSELPLSLNEITQKLNGEPKPKISKTLKRLIKFKEIQVIELNKFLAMKFFNYNRRMCLYFRK